MSEPRRTRRAPYRLRAFTHWLNLALLAVGGVASVAWDPSVLFALGPLEIGLMWVIPDLPGFRARIDKQEDAKAVQTERAYYATQLWGLQPPAKKSLGRRLAGWFAEAKPEDIDARIVDQRCASFAEYREMREIVAKLGELETVRGVTLAGGDLGRFEVVINGYLRYTLAARYLGWMLDDSDADKLRAEMAAIDAQLASAAPDLRTVLEERRRLLQLRLERIPKLYATFELFRARADAIVHQMRNIQGQVLADPGMDVNAFLEDLIERQEILADPIGALEADKDIEALLRSRPEPAQTAKAAAAAAARARGAAREV